VHKARSIEPLTAFTRTLLSGRRREDLVLAHVPEEAIVFRYGNKRIVSVAALQQAWNLR
jgi:hypothetical protein